jgi:glycosyltransferase involved in cell wall biosynthesis
MSAIAHTDLDGQPLAPSPVPRVSIGLPVFNGDAYLEEAIESLLGQTFTDFELLISDNASTDRTEEICRRYAARDPRVQYWRNPRNIGGMRNANLTLERARGEYFRWAAHDDICGPTMLERLVAELDARPDVAVAFAAAVAIDTDGEPITGYPVAKRALKGGKGFLVSATDDTGVRIPTEGTAARPSERIREVLYTRCPCEATYGLIRADVLRDTVALGDFTYSDTVLLCDLAMRTRFHLIPEPLFKKRFHTGNRYIERGPGRMVWSRPELAESGRPVCPYWLVLKGYLTVVWRAPVPWRERLRCLPPVARWARLRYRALGWDIAFAAIMVVHSKQWRRACYSPDNWIAEGM